MNQVGFDFEMLQEVPIHKLPTIPSLIKWTGSKRKQAKTIQQFAPKYDRYVEPFLGGGAMLYYNSQSALVSDLYQPLIDFWDLVKDQPERLSDEYAAQWEQLQDNLPGHFYFIRDRFNSTQSAFDLNFLLRTCVNGIVRFNEKGEFNNSFHLSRRGMKPDTLRKNILTWSEKIQGVQFECCDYQTTLEMCHSGDFVYMDPPYAGSKNRYIADLDIERLMTNLELLNRKSVKWALSFDGTRGDKDLSFNLPEELYKRRVLLSNGSSAVHRVLNGPLEEVQESLYLNF